MENLRYYWLRDEKKNPVACIASRKQNGIVEFTVAAHNPIDKFNKRLGREIAVGRFTNPIHIWTVNTVDNVKIAILNAILQCPTLTSARAVKAAMYQKAIYKERVPSFPKG
jgi:hypothetical protein